MRFATFAGLAVLTAGLMVGCQNNKGGQNEPMDITAQALLQGSVPKVEPAPEPVMEAEMAAEGDAAAEGDMQVEESAPEAAPSE